MSTEEGPSVLLHHNNRSSLVVAIALGRCSTTGSRQAITVIVSGHGSRRAWCHDRPEQRDPSIAYKTLGSVSSIIPTLQVIVDLASRATARATGSDDGRSVTDAHDEVDLTTQDAIRSLANLRLAIDQAHEIVSHLIFFVDDGDADLTESSFVRKRTPPGGQPWQR